MLKVVVTIVQQIMTGFKGALLEERQGKCKQGCLKLVSCPLLCTTCIEMMLLNTWFYQALFADDTCPYATDRKEGFVVRKLQPGLSSMETWYER
jgi:hypothetical protein